MGNEPMAALKQANRAKFAAAQLRAQIRAGGPRVGARRAADAVRAADSSLSFFALLKTVPGIGDTTARLMLDQARIDPVARVDARRVSEPQRERLVGGLLRHGEAVRR